MDGGFFPREVLPRLQELGTLLGRGAIYDWARHAAAIGPIDRPALTVLVTLRYAGEPLRVGDIARRMRVEGPHVTRHLNALHEQKLVERLSTPDDRRARLIALTLTGTQLVDRYLDVVHGMFDRVTDRWGEDTRTVLVDLLQQLLDGLHAELDGLGLEPGSPTVQAVSGDEPPQVDDRDREQE